MKAYLISGLAADERMFRYLRYPDGIEPVPLPWIEPLHNETLPEYALRLSQKIDTGVPFVVIGLSFGGMIATEIGLRYPQATVLLISSISCIAELPYYFRWAGKISLHRVVSSSMLKKAAKWKRVFSTESSQDKKMIRDMIEKSDPRFVDWSINAILNWKNADRPSRFFHIHGNADLILPSRFTKQATIIKGGKHLMILDRASEINEWIRTVLTSPFNITQ